VHGAEHHHHDAIGEVYVVGVDPSEQGRGLGPALTLIGLHHLQSQGLDEVLLYVDESNVNAIRVYEGLGFTRYATDVSWSRG
jgi:mycothiol synthase